MRDQENQQEHLRSRRQVAERWSVSVSSVIRAERKGLLPVIKIGTHARYRVRDLEAIEQASTIR
jgi:hypothetical protein